MTAEKHDAGGSRKYAVKEGVRSGAVFSECGRYRHLLWREWGEKNEPPSALWVGMNPSTATAELDDPTITRELGFTDRLGLRRYVKANVMDYRATYPKALLGLGICPCSPDNLQAIREAADTAHIIILAYGSLQRRLVQYGTQVAEMIMQDGREVWAVGLNKNGSPKHPLFVRGDAPLIRLR